MARQEVWLGNYGPFIYDDATDLPNRPGETQRAIRTNGRVRIGDAVNNDEAVTRGQVDGDLDTKANLDGGNTFTGFQLFSNDIRVVGQIQAGNSLSPGHIRGMRETFDHNGLRFSTFDESTALITKMRISTFASAAGGNTARHGFVNSNIYEFLDGNVEMQNNLDITGSLTKGSGSFRIDHPLDKENKDLIYSFIEGPRRDLLFRGSVTLKNGKAVVDIDQASKQMRGTFDAFTKNAVVASLQNMDSFNRLKASDISEGSFTIECEDPNSTDQVVWVVLSERDDDFVRNRDPHTGENGSLIPEWEKEDPTEVDVAGRKTTAIQDNKGKKGYPRHASACGYNEDSLYCDEEEYRKSERGEKNKMGSSLNIHKINAEEDVITEIFCTIAEAGKSVSMVLTAFQKVFVNKCSTADLVKLIETKEEVRALRDKMRDIAKKEEKQETYIIKDGEITKQE